MATTPRKDLPGTNAPNWSQRVTEELRVLMGRAGNGRALTARDLIDSGIAKPGAGGGLVPGVPGGGDSEPDLTPPPVPTGFTVTAGLSTVFVEHDAPGYTQGHGHDRTVVYGVLQTGSTAPTFDQAVVLFQFQGTIGAYPAALGTRYRLWIKWQSQDGVQSASPAGGTNGLDVQTGKIGNNDLGPLIVEAGNLANSAVTAAKIAAAAVDVTKFANGIEPVGIVSGGSLPTVKSTTAIVFGGKLYRWDTATGKYTSAVPAVDLTGQIASGQLADNAVTVAKIASGAVDAGKLASNAVTADKIAAAAVDATKFASGIEPVGISSSPTLPTVKSTSTIVWQNKLYRWDAVAGKYTADVSTVDISGQISSVQLADNAVTVAKIASGAVDAGKLASNAVTADKIAAAAVDATKFASGIEPVGISTGPTLPTVRSTSTIVWQNKLYRWDAAAGKYTAATAAADVTGQLTDAQLAAISAAKLTGQITGTQITDGAISTPKIAAGAVTASQIAAGAVTAGKIAANAVTAAEIAAGAITTAKLAAGAVTANEIAANAVTTAKIAAGAVTATEIAAKAVTASKLVIGDTSNLIFDPDFQDVAAWSAGASSFAFQDGEVTDGVQRVAAYTVADRTGGANAYAGEIYTAPYLSVETGRTLYLMVRVRDYLAAAGTVQLGLAMRKADGTVATTNRQSYLLGAADGYATLSASYVVAADDVGIAWRVRLQFSAVGAFKGPFKLMSPAMRQMASGELIVDGAVTATKIAAGAITAGKVAAGSITATELATGSVTTAKVAAGAITATEIGANAITAVKIAAGAVTAGKIAANAVTATEISAGAVTSGKIAAGAVSATEIAAGAITATKLVLGDTSNLFPDYNHLDLGFYTATAGSFGLTSSGAAANGMNIMNIAPSASDSEVVSGWFSVEAAVDYFVSGRVSQSIAESAGGAAALYIELATVTPPAAPVPTRRVLVGRRLNSTSAAATTTTLTTAGAERLARAVYIRESGGASRAYIGAPMLRRMASGELVVDGAITAAKIAAKAITAAQIAAGSITTAELGANSVTTAQIAAGAVTANEIAANAITAVKIAAGAVTAGKIAANAVTANEIAANAVTTAQIAAGAVTATEISAGAITAAKLAITATNTINLDPFFQDASLWVASGFTRKAADAAAPGPFVISATASVNMVAIGTLTPIDTTKTYLFEAWYRALAASTNRAFATIRFYDVNGVLITGQNMAGWPGNNNPAGNYYFPATNAITPQVWTRYTLTVGPSGTAKFPDGAMYFAYGTFLNYSGAAPIVETQWGGLRVTEMSRGELIVDGAITATKIAANAIAVGTAAIQDGAIVNAMIGNGAIDNAKIAVAAIDTAKIANGAIQNANIANAAVDNAKISNMSAAKLTAGALAVGSYINSSNYISGSQGWSINANGQAEFSGVIVRGSIYSNAGIIGGISINGNGLNSGGFSGYQWPAAGQNGFHIGPNGILLGNANSGRYVEIQSNGNIFMPGFNIQNGNATFFGNLSGVSGTFSGTLTAREVVTTDNLKPNAVTTPLYAYASAPFSNNNAVALSLWVPEFYPGEICSVDFGFCFTTGQNGEAACHLYVDGSYALGLPISSPTPEPQYRLFNFSYPISGNGNARTIAIYIINVSQATHRYIKATIMRR